MDPLTTALTITTILENLTSLGIKLVNLFTQGRKDKQKAEAEAARFMYGVYSEIKKNLNRIDGYPPGAFRKIAANSSECKELAAGFSVTAMTGLLTQGFNTKVGGKDAGTLAALDKAIRFTENFRSLTEMSDKLLAVRRKPRMELRIKHIREQHLAAYVGLFKK